MSPAWMPCRASTASYMSSGSPNQRQCVATASMPKLTRNSRATVVSTDALPPCELARDNLAQTGAVHPLPDLDQHMLKRFGRKAQRARRQQVFVRLADGLDRQHQHAEFGRQAILQQRDHAFGDRGVGHHRQMRAVLLGRGDRQNGNRLFRIESPEIVALQFGPEKRPSRHARLLCSDFDASAVPMPR